MPAINNYLESIGVTATAAEFEEAFELIRAVEEFEKNNTPSAFLGCLAPVSRESVRFGWSYINFNSLSSTSTEDDLKSPGMSYQKACAMFSSASKNAQEMFIDHYLDKIDVNQAKAARVVSDMCDGNERRHNEMLARWANEDKAKSDLKKQKAETEVHVRRVVDQTIASLGNVELELLRQVVSSLTLWSDLCEKASPESNEAWLLVCRQVARANAINASKIPFHSLPKAAQSPVATSESAHYRVRGTNAQTEEAFQRAKSLCASGVGVLQACKLAKVSYPAFSRRSRIQQATASVA